MGKNRMMRNVRKNKMIKTLSLMAAGVIALMGMAPASLASEAKEKKPEKKQEVDLNGTYHARMGIQTSTLLWIMQMNYYKGKSNETLGTELENKLFCADQEDSEKLVSKEGTFNEVEISGNGVYTVTLENANFEGETDISQLHVATDIPLNDQIKFSNVKVMVNDMEFVTFDEAVMEDEAPYLEGGMVVLAMNHWRGSVVSYLKEHGCSESGENGWRLLSGQGGENISITFTVSGFAKDNPDAVEVTPTPNLASSEGNADASSESSEKAVGSSATVLIVVGVAIVAVIAGAVLVRRLTGKK